MKLDQVRRRIERIIRKISAECVKAYMIKVRIYIVSSKQGITHTKINRKVTLQLDVMFMKTNSFANFQLKISKHVGGKCGKLCISNILCSKMDITCKKNLTESDDTWTWFVVHKKKVWNKISAENTKACMRKVQKTVYFQYPKKNSITCSKYTRAPWTVHNTPVMNILKGYFYITLF